MKNHRSVILAILGLVTAVAGFSFAGADAKNPEQLVWEYHVLNLRANVSDAEEQWKAELNKAGADGWDVAGTAPYERGGDTMSIRIILKRPKR